MDDHLIRIVTKAYVLKFYVSDYFCHICRLLHDLIFFLFFQEFKHTLCRCCHGLHLICYLCDLLDWLCETLHILDKRLNITNGNNSTDCQHTAAECNCRITKVSDKLHDRHHDSGKELGFPCRSIQYVIGLVELSNHLVFFIISFDHQMTAIAFLYLTIDMSKVFLLCDKVFL